MSLKRDNAEVLTSMISGAVINYLLTLAIFGVSGNFAIGATAVFFICSYCGAWLSGGYLEEQKKEKRMTLIELIYGDRIINFSCKQIESFEKRPCKGIGFHEVFIVFKSGRRLFRRRSEKGETLKEVKRKMKCKNCDGQVPIVDTENHLCSLCHKHFTAELFQADNIKQMVLPTGSKERKQLPLFMGVFNYFPDAVVAVAHQSQVGNDKHNPGEPLHWAREKSNDDWDCLTRHQLDLWQAIQSGDAEAIKEHAGALAWRGLAVAQKALEDLS